MAATDGKINLLVVTTSFPTLANPSSGIFVQKLIEKLPVAIRVSVLTPAGQSGDWNPATHDRIRVRPFRYAPVAWQQLCHRPGGMPVMLSQKPILWLVLPAMVGGMLLAVLQEARKADLIHAQWSLCGIVAGVAGTITGTPVVTTFRGEDVNRCDRSPLARLVLRACIRLNDHLVAVSSAMARRIAKFFPQKQKKLSVIVNGVGEAFRSVARAREPESIDFVAVGSLIPRKRLDLSINAFAILARERSDVRLWVVGDGPQRDPLESLVKQLALDGRVSFAGQLAPDRLAPLLAESRAMVLSSASEGRPNVVLEAMAAGVPVIAADIEGVREMIGNNKRGLLFTSGDIMALADRMRQLLDPSLGRRLADEGRQWIMNRQLTWRRTAQQYVQLYRNILENRD